MDWARIGSCYVGWIFIGPHFSIFSDDKNINSEKFDFDYCIPFTVVVGLHRFRSNKYENQIYNQMKRARER